MGTLDLSVVQRVKSSREYATEIRKKRTESAEPKDKQTIRKKKISSPRDPEKRRLFLLLLRPVRNRGAPGSVTRGLLRENGKGEDEAKEAWKTPCRVRIDEYD